MYIRNFIKLGSSEGGGKEMMDIQVGRKKTESEIIRKEYNKFCDGNAELLVQHAGLIGFAFEAGYLAGKEAKK